MKLNDIKLILKYFIIIVLIGLFIYFLYKILSNNLIEHFDPYDCGDCKMNPTSGNCFEIQKLDTAVYPEDTNFIFCPWQPNCSSNIVNQSERINMSNLEIANNDGVIPNICCSGSEFYDKYTDFYKNFYIPKKNLYYCNNVDKNSYLKSSLCDKNFANQDTKGMLFKRQEDGKSVVFLKDKMKPSEILDYIAINNINQELVQKNRAKYNIIIKDLNQLADNSDNTLNTSEQDRVDEHKRVLYFDFSLSSVIDINYQYQVYDTSQQKSNGYLLNENQFYSCSGDIVDQQQFDDMSFNQDQLNELSNNNYFGDPTLNTLENQEARFYNTENDLKMQLKNLPDLNQSSMAPVSVINQYMTAINSFYEKQMANMMGPKTHSVNDTLQFDNDTLETKKSTFFSYDDETNNTYDCHSSITGDPNFEYCGPKPYCNDKN